jgi:dTDP-4-dehydrorhamnose 3,5-epimerase
MMIKPLMLEGAFHLTPPRFTDPRGWFSETWSAQRLADAGIPTHFIQDNMSHSVSRGTLRGLHFQYPPYTQAKLIMVVRGAIQDVIVDIRVGSKTFGQFATLTLTADAGDQVFIPKGMAHGFCTLTDDTCVLYKVDAPYAPGHEGGIIWNDHDLNIPWELDNKKPTLSQKDEQLPLYRDVCTRLNTQS